MIYFGGKLHLTRIFVYDIYYINPSASKIAVSHK